MTKPHWITRIMSACLLITALVFALASGAMAQTPANNPDLPVITSDLTEAEFQAMLGRLSDEQVRDILIQEFAARRAAAPAEPSEGFLANADTIVATILDNAQALWSKWPELGAGFGAVLSRLSAAGGLGKALLALLISVLVGFTLRHFWRRKAAQRQMALAERNIDKGAYGTLGTIGDAVEIGRAHV